MSINRVLVEGSIAGCVGALAFAAVHAVLIVPIWRRVPGGLLQAVPAGVHAADWPGAIGSLAIAVAAGWGAAWALTHEHRASRAMAIATAVLTIGASGPIPVVNGPRAAWLFVGFLPICVLAGATVALVRKDTP